MSDYYIFNGELYSEDELKHHGVKGMKWGVRRATRVKSVYAHKAKKQIDINKKFVNVAEKRIRSGVDADNRPLTNDDIRKLKNDIDHFTKAAKEWISARNDIMNMDVSVITAKDVKQRFKNTRSVAGGAYIY